MGAHAPSPSHRPARLASLAAFALLSACEKDNRWDKVVQVMDQMHANNMHASPLNYSRIINALGERGEVVKAVEIFQKLQVSFLRDSKLRLESSD